MKILKYNTKTDELEETIEFIDGHEVYYKLKGERQPLQLNGVGVENNRGEWVPPIYCPYYFGWRLKKCKCICGKKFKNEEDYRAHYAYKHILYPDKN